MLLVLMYWWNWCEWIFDLPLLGRAVRGSEARESPRCSGWCW